MSIRSEDDEADIKLDGGVISPCSMPPAFPLQLPKGSHS